MLKYKDYKEHYRRDGEVFDFEETITSPHQMALVRLQQHVLAIARPKEDESVLDIGCGSGWLLGALGRHGMRRVYGVDLSRGQYLKGKRTRGLQIGFAEGDAYRLPFKESSLDVVLMTEVLEHLESPVVTLKEAARVLRGGGRLVVTVPWRERIYHTLCIHCNKKTPVNAHLRSFDTEGLSDMLSKTGMRVVRVDHLLNKALVVLRIHLLLKFLPSSLWLFVDRTAGLFFSKWTNICARADKPL